MRTKRNALRSTVSSFSFAVAAALVVSGCAEDPFARLNDLQRAQHLARSSALMSQSATPPTQLLRPDERDFAGGAAYWGAQYQANPTDLDSALNFSRNLRLMGGARQALTVMKEAVVAHPNEGRALAEYGKCLTAAGRPQDGIAFLTSAIQSSPNDWSLLSARGVAYDQAGDRRAARADYEAALALSDDNSTVLTNLALSHVLAGDPAAAEPILRRVVARPDATAPMRQNLAMVLSLLGRPAEAETLGRADLTIDDANSNANLFSQFELPQRSAALPASPAGASMPQDLPAQTAAVVPASIPDAPASQEIAASDTLMGSPEGATPTAVEPVATAQPLPVLPARTMAPIPDEAAPKPSLIAQKSPPKKATRPVIKAAPSTQDGEHLITTVDGIPVYGSSKKAPTEKPEAALKLRSSTEL